MVKENSLHLRSDCKDPYLNWGLRRARIQAGYTTEELGRKIGLTAHAIVRYERLRALPIPERANKLSEILGRGVDELFPFKKLREITREITHERNNGSSLRYGSRGSLTNPYLLHQIQEELLAQEYETRQIDAREKIGEVLQTLSSKEKTVIELRYGLLDRQEYTLDETRRILSMSKQRVGQIEHKAIKKLQHPTRKRLLAQLL